MQCAIEHCDQNWLKPLEVRSRAEGAEGHHVITQPRIEKRSPSTVCLQPALLPVSKWARLPGIWIRIVESCAKLLQLMRAHKVGSHGLEILAGDGRAQNFVNPVLDVGLVITGTDEPYTMFGDERRDPTIGRHMRKDGALRLNIRRKLHGQARPPKTLEAKSTGIHGINKIAAGENW